MIKVPRLHDIGERMLCESGWSDISDRDRKLNLMKLMSKTKWVLGQSHPVYFMLNHYLYRLGRTNMPYSKIDNDVLNREILAYCLQDTKRNINADLIKPEDVLVDDQEPKTKTQLLAKTKISVRLGEGKEASSTWGNMVVLIIKHMRRSHIKSVGGLAKAICRLSPASCISVLSSSEIEKLKKRKKEQEKKEEKEKGKDQEESSDKLYNPLGKKGKLSSRFRLRKLKSEKKADMHAGIDLAAKKGTPVYSVADGVVRKVKRNSRGYGRYVLVDHPGLRHMGLPLSSLYAHVGDIKVKEGDEVKRGQQLASVDLVGTHTGAHLHFEIRVTGDRGRKSLVVDDEDMEKDQAWPLGRLWKSGYGNYNFNPLEMSYSPSLPAPRDKKRVTA